MVRDPVERFVSSFSYRRKNSSYHRKQWKIHQGIPPKEWFEKNISSCVLSGDPECQYNPESNYPTEQILTYFCGSSPECKRMGSKLALQKGSSYQVK